MKTSFAPNSRIWIYIFCLFLALMFYIYGYKLAIEYGNFTDEGDFGRDLYLFAMASRGKLPYVDFNWIYGPLSPISFGIFLKIFGVSVYNVLTCWYLWFLSSVALLFYFIRSFSNNLIAFMATYIFILYYEPFEIPVFNHICGLPFIVLALIFLKKFIDTDKNNYLFYLFLSAFGLAIVKLNTGFAFILMLFGSLFLYFKLNKKSLKPLVFSFIICIALCALSYGSLLLYSPLDQISKSFPYSANLLQKNNMSYLDSLLQSGVYFIESFNPDLRLGRFFEFFSKIYYSNIVYFIVPLLAFFVSIALGISKGLKNKSFSLLVILLFLSIALLHEFIMIKSIFSLKLWSLVLIVPLATFSIIQLFDIIKNKKFIFLFKHLVLGFIMLGVIVKSYYFFLPVNTKAYYYDNPRVKVSFVRYRWYLLMTKIIDYIEDNVPKGDKILTLPFCNYYNFVTERDQPSRIIEFLALSGVSEEDQKQVIRDIEENKVKTVINIIIIGEKWSGFGRIGVTHCKTLAKYINKNYEIDTSFYEKYLYGYKIPISIFKRTTPFVKDPAKIDYTVFQDVVE